MKVRDAFYEVLRTHGMTTIFGNPGSNELPLLRDFPNDFTYVLALHEGAAIGMAEGLRARDSLARICQPARGGGHRQRDGQPHQHAVGARDSC